MCALDCFTFMKVLCGWSCCLDKALAPLPAPASYVLHLQLAFYDRVIWFCCALVISNYSRV